MQPYRDWLCPCANSVARHSDVGHGSENVDLAIDAYQRDGPDGCICGVELGA